MNYDSIIVWHRRFLLHLAIALLPCFCFLPPSVHADDRIVKVGVYENAPKIFISESGQPAGIFIDIIQEIGKREGWNLQYVPGTWGEGLDRLVKGEIDLMPDVAYTSDRETMYAFHKVPVLSTWSQVYARKESGIRSILDLRGKRIAVLERSVQQGAFARLSADFELDATLIPVADYDTIYQMVAKNEADAAISNRFHGLMHAKQVGLEDTTIVFQPAALFFAAPRSAPKQVLDTIDSHLLNLKNDSQSVYYESLKRWTSEQVRFKFPAWVQALALFVSVVLLMSLIGSVVLRRQVEARTRALFKRNKQMAIMDRTLRSTTTELHLQAILDNALQGALDLTRLEGGMLCLLDRNTGRLIHGASINASGEVIADLISQAMQTGNCLCGHAARDGEPLIFGDNAPAGVFAKREAVNNEGVGFNATFSLKVRNESIGVLSVFSRTDDRPDPRKLALVQDICGPVALAIENARLYEQVIRHTEELEKRVTERTAELAVAMEKAQAADRIKSAFLATMSHELRTPLNSIIGFTGIMLQGLTGPLNEEQLKQMTMVQGSARHLLALINDVLDISKIEAGQFELAITSFDLRSSIEGMVKLVSPLAEKKGIDLRLEIADETQSATTDQRRLEQVILNLLNNALKFTEKGQVRISCRSENDHYLLAVTDTGIGMRPEELPDLFQPFHQIDTGLSRKHEGSGLGLSICKKLVEMMGGTIQVESQWGQGSTLAVRFPRTTGDSS
jgi:signal transduction histidine kinase/ABC-type amino acid transport substrate-binding protein